MKGWGPKSSVCPSKPRESNFLGGISRDFARISRWRPKSLRKKVCVQFPFPNHGPEPWSAPPHHHGPEIPLCNNFYVLFYCPEAPEKFEKKKVSGFNFWPLKRNPQNQGKEGQGGVNANADSGRKDVLGAFYIP